MDSCFPFARCTVFRAKYLDALQEAFEQARLTFAAGTADLAHAETFARFIAELRAGAWVVYAKPPFGRPAHALQYLGRYTHRVAISNPPRGLARRYGAISL